MAVGDAGVDSLVLHGPLEEALAAFAGDDAIVEPGGLVLADHAHHRLLVLVDHPVGRLQVAVPGKVGAAGLGVSWQLLDVPLPQLGHVDARLALASTWRQRLQAGKVGILREAREHRSRGVGHVA